MSQASKSELWKELKERGAEFPNHYREYTVPQLQEALETLNERQGSSAEIILPGSETPAAPVPSALEGQAGLTLNTHEEGQPLFTDAEGLTWFQEEVVKSAFPKPRARRVLKYNDPGFKNVEVRSGNVSETFEMPGDRRQVSEAKVTLPSFQVGIYRDPKFPMFRVITYAGERGFDLFDVQSFFGGPDLVPSDVKRKYVSQTLCYDMMTVVRAVQAEARELQLRTNPNLR